jgi:glycosyltransferase involved in cell wall biosynthesis
LKEVLSGNIYDIIQFESLSAAQYLPMISGRIKGARTILTVHAIISLQAKRIAEHAPWYKKIYYTLQYFLTLNYEKRLLSRFDDLITISELEKRRLVDFGLDERLVFVNISGVDTGIHRGKDMLEEKHHNIVSIGTLKFLPNKDGLLWFLDRVFPKVTSALEDAKTIVIGEGDVSVEDRYSSDERIVFRGVIKDLSEEMGRGILFIAPIRMGAGIRTKIVTAMAYGMPVVTTSVGIEGIKASEKEGVIIEDTEEGFADAVAGLLKDRGKRIALGEAGRRFVEELYSWDSIAHELEMFYNSGVRKEHERI